MATAPVLALPTTLSQRPDPPRASDASGESPRPFFAYVQRARAAINSGDLATAQRLIEAGLTQARAQEDRSLEAEYLRLQVSAYFTGSRFEDMLSAAEEMHELATLRRNELDQQLALQSLTYASYYLEDFASTIRWGQQTHRLAERNNIWAPSTFNVLLFTGWAHYEFAQDEQAYAISQALLEQIDPRQDADYYLRALVLAGTTSFANAQYQHTIEYAQTALPFTEHLDADYYSQMQTFGLLGAAYYELGAYDSAIPYLGEATKLAIDLENAASLEWYGGRLADAFYEVEAYDAALAFRELLVITAEALQDEAWQIDLWTHIGFLRVIVGDHSGALQAGEQLLSLSAASPTPESRGRISTLSWLIIALGNLGQGNLAQSDRALTLAEDEAQQLNSQEMIQMVASVRHNLNELPLSTVDDILPDILEFHIKPPK